MCGIFFSLSQQEYLSPDPATRERLQKRGPDASHELQVKITCGHGGPNDRIVYATFLSTVLSLRGQAIVQQPLADEETGSILCWNGEAWKVTGNHLGQRSPCFEGHYTDRIDGNDTELVFKLLLDASKASLHNKQSRHQDILEAISTITGPHAFVYYDATNRCIYYARDCLGRRSLLRCQTPSNDLVLASSSGGLTHSSSNASESTAAILTPSSVWQEVEADGIYIIDLTDTIDADRISNEPETSLDNGLSSLHWNSFRRTLIPYIASDTDPRYDGTAVVMQYPRLNTTIPHIGNNQSNLTGPDMDESPSALNLYSPAVEKLEVLLRSSLDIRLHGLGTPDATGDLSNSANMAILFSGGLDCSVIARLVHDLLPASDAVDLLNVAFENPRIHKSHSSPYDVCPDRITGRNSHNELERICPGRLWRFVEINVPYSETLQHRDTIISLIHPHDTEMDLSIAMALYFASRGRGITRSSSESDYALYNSRARVLLSGLGADELFGGYQRHATAFSRHGFGDIMNSLGLMYELQLDVGRLGKRNLGRDDRVLSHWSRETRFPYLDEELVAWAMEANIWEKTGFGFNQQDTEGIEPGKLVLRLVALKLGMKDVASEKKRAIQFGARTAKMTTGKTRGTQSITATTEHVST